MQKVHQVSAVNAQDLRRLGLHTIGGVERFQNDLSLHKRERALSDGCAVVCGRSLSGKLAHAVNK